MIFRNLANRTLTCSKNLPVFIVAYEISDRKERYRKVIKRYEQQLKSVQSLNFNEKQKIEYQSKQIKEINQRFSVQINSQEQKIKEEYIKQYLMSHMDNTEASEELVDLPKSQRKGFIPNYLVLKKLYFGKREIMLIGVRDGLEQHALFTKKIIESLKISSVVVDLPPDLPFFIRTETSFIDQWRNFLINPNVAVQSRFYINPTPTKLSEASLHGAHIRAVKHGLIKSDEFYEMIHTILKLDSREGQFISDPLLTPFVINGIQNLYFAGIPLVKERLEQAKRIPMDILKDLFEIYKQDQKKASSHFDPSMLFPDKQMRLKLNHLCNVTRLVSFQSQGRTALLVTADEAQKISDHWKSDRQQTMSSYFNFEESQWPKITMIDLVEKLVILDLILKPFLQDYYVRYESFPFLLEKTIGGKENIGKVFMIWEHYYHTYSRKLAEARQLRTLNYS